LAVGAELDVLVGGGLACLLLDLLIRESANAGTTHVGSDQATDATEEMDDCRSSEILEALLLKPASSPGPGAGDGVNEARDEEGEEHVVVDDDPLAK